MAYLNNKKLFQVVKVAFTPAIYQVKTVTPANQESVITADSGYAALSKVILDGILVDPHYSYTTYSDSTIAYTKTVPSGALDIASIDRVGGQSYKHNQLLNTNLVTFPRTINGITFTLDSNGQIILNGTATDNVNLLFTYSYNVIESGHIYFRRNIASNGLAIYGYPTLDNESIITASGNNVYLSLRIPIGTVVTNYEYKGMCVDLTNIYGSGNEPSTVAAFLADFPEYQNYVAYDAGSIRNVFPTTIDVQDEDGYDFTDIIDYVEDAGYDLSLSTSTSLYNYVDMENVKAVINVASVDLGTLDWQYVSDDNAFRAILSTAKTGAINTTPNIISDTYTIVARTYIAGIASQNKCMNMGVNNSYIQLCDNDYTDATTLKSALSGKYINFELATPVEIDLSSLIDASTINVSTGVLYFVNEYNYAVPSSITYLVEV